MKLKQNSSSAQNASTGGESTEAFIKEARSGKISTMVKPGSRENSVEGYDAGRKAWIIRVNAQPEKGKANAELLKYVRKITGCQFVIKSGAGSREKRLEAISSYSPSSQRTPQGQ